MAKLWLTLENTGERKKKGSHRTTFDRMARWVFYGLSAVPIILIVVILAVLIKQSWPILSTTSLLKLIGGKTWLPREGIFGFSSFIMGTFWVTLLALVFAVPPCLLTAIYLSEYAKSKTRAIIKPLLDILAAIPSVVYGVWGMIAIVPFVKYLGSVSDNLSRYLPFLKSNNPTGFSILSGSIVLAVMIAPLIIAITFEVFRTVPIGFREASLAVGANKWETIKYAVLPKTKSGIIAGVVLSASRALGETMAVLMVVGNVAKLPNSIFDPAYPLPALIANNYGEMLSIPLYQSALMLAALILLVIVLIFNILAALLLRRIDAGAKI